MEQLQELLSYLRMFQPRILSVGSEHTLLKKVSYIHQGQTLYPHTIYVGYSSEISYLLRFNENITFFLINEADRKLPEEFCQNYCISFPEDTDPDSLMEECRAYFNVQTELYEYSHILMETFISGASLQDIITRTEQMIDNPIMVIDNSYRVICESGSESCGDVVWCENIKNGYCSYEFITQFNRISEVRNISTNSDAFLSGCLNSPLRRSICKLRDGGHILGYLLAIELNSPFTELKMEILELVSKLVSRMIAHTDSVSFGGSSMQNLFSDMLSGRLKSKDILQNYLNYSHIKMESSYYLISVNIKDYNLQGHPTNNTLEQELSKIMDYTLTACVGTNIIFLTERRDSLVSVTNELQRHRDFFTDNNLTVAVSDNFTSLEDLSIYYRQTNFTHRTIRRLNLDEKTICTYDNLRIMDIITRNPTLDNYLDLVGSDYVNIRQYDDEHNTEYSKTLYYYIRWNHNLNRVAEILCVHKNTVSYRIQRAKELFDLDLKDFHVTMHIYVGYLIYLLKDNGLLRHEGED